MSYKMFLDDIRYPSCVGYDDSEFKVVRTFYEAVDMIDTYGIPSFISFDHDLGMDHFDGYDLAKYIVEIDMNNYLNIPKYFRFNVHSANPVGKINIESYLNNYLKQKAKEAGEYYIKKNRQVLDEEG